MVKRKDKAETSPIAESVLKVVAEEVAPKGESTSGELLLSTGLTLLNLACSDSRKGGWATGKVVNVVGDSSTGKTFLCMGVAAEAANDSRFDKHTIVFDDIEQSCEFDIEKLFGSKLAKRIQAPRQVDGEDCCSETIQELYDHVTDFLDNGKPVIYIVDSFDALTTKEELAFEEAAKEQRRKKENAKPKKEKVEDGPEGTPEKKEKVKGTYGMEKAKYASRIFRMLTAKLKKTKSILIIISQIRDNIDPGTHKKHTRAGGKALQFYCSHVMWLAGLGQIKKTVRGMKVSIGGDVLIEVTKNKLTGKRRDVAFPIYYDYGIDDIGSCIDFLCEADEWKVRDGKIVSSSLELESKTLTNAIREVEDKGLVARLHRETESVWKDIEDKLKLNRKAKYE